MVLADYPQWESRIVRRSQLFLHSYLSHQLSDLNDWEGKAWVFNDRRTVTKHSGILFNGEIGTGKHTALASFIKVYCDVDGLGYGFYSVNSVDLPLTIEDCSAFESNLEQLLQKCRDRKQNVVLLIDGIENCEFIDIIFDLLTEQSYLCNGMIDFLFFVVSNKRLELTSLFSKITCTLFFDRTTSEQRLIYLKVKANNYISEENASRFVELLGACTYGELSTVVDNISLISLSEQRPVNESEFACVVDRCVKSRFDSVKQHPDFDFFFNRLEGCLAKFSNTVITNVVPEGNLDKGVEDSIETLGLSDYQDKKRKEFYEMPPKELAESLWGENGLNEILEKADYYRSLK